MDLITCKLKPYIKPFEQKLAIRELSVLAKAEPCRVTTACAEPLYSIRSTVPLDYLASRLTYWEELRNGSSIRVQPVQVKREATVTSINGNNRRNTQEGLPFNDFTQPPSRRVLRYGTHNIHEYRGKFFPQLVRSLLNIADTRKNDIIIDSMCGSGTTLAESVLMGCQAYGLDLNPLSVEISRAKCDILKVKPSILYQNYKILKDAVRKDNGKMEFIWLSSLSETSREYLRNWFPERHLSELDKIMTAINDIRVKECRQLFTISLSNIIRRVSYQKNDDLRVRKEREVAICNVVEEFLIEAGQTVESIAAFLSEIRMGQIGQASVKEGDSREADVLLRAIRGSVDTIITSPPYATALPYLDTDRLSLYFLNLLPRNNHRKRDVEMIGNREITNGQRYKYFDYYEKHRKFLPQNIVKTIDLINRLNDGTDVGFRRRNLPSLLSKYFFDMRDVFNSYKNLLKKGGHAFVVVGNNHTIAGGERIEIQTDMHLAELGEMAGLTLVGTVSMDMLISRDIFRNNAGTAETILEFRKD